MRDGFTRRRVIFFFGHLGHYEPFLTKYNFILSSGTDWYSGDEYAAAQQDYMLAESLSDHTPLSLSSLQRFENLKTFHEENILAFIRGSKVFILSGQRLLKCPISVQLATMRICTACHCNQNYFVTLFPSISARRRLTTVIESRVKEFISLARMKWPWSIGRLSDLLDDEETDFTDVFFPVSKF